MYTIDEFDEVIELTDLPQCSIGVPIPLVLAEEGRVLIAYFLKNTPKGWDGETVKIVDVHTSDQPSCLIRFDPCFSHMFGAPYEEILSGHPLASRGLGLWGAYEVRNSSWIRRLERMNSLHENHNKETFLKNWRHFILTFKYSTFECIAEGFEVEIALGSVVERIRYGLDHKIEGS